MTSAIAERINSIRQTLPNSVRLIGVTKQVSVQNIRAAYFAGIRDFGESRIQEAIEKQTQLQDLPDIKWHFIGHLQSNKAQKALEHFQVIHSLDNLKLAQRLNRLAEEISIQPEVLLQIKILPDHNKHGWTIPELLTDIPELNLCNNLKIQGLMTIPPLGLNETQTLALFQETRALANQIEAENWPNIKMHHLSMGMSEDYHLAIKAGATYIRLGTVIFGDRNT